MTLHYNVSPEEIVAFNSWYTDFSSEGKKRMRTFRVALYLLPLILNIGFGSLRPHLLPTLMVVTVIETLLVALYLPRRLKHIQRGYLLKLFGKREYAHLFGKASMEIQEEGLLSVTDQTTSLIKWSAIQEIVTTDTHAFFRMGPIQAAVIARDKVEEGNFDAFIAEARRLHQQAIGIASSNPVPIPAR